MERDFPAAERAMGNLAVLTCDWTRIHLSYYVLTRSGEVSREVR